MEMQHPSPLAQPAPPPPMPPMTDDGSRHPVLTRALHWASAGAIVICAAAAIWRNVIEHEQLRIVLLDVHRQAGLFVLLALGLRIAQRVRRGLADHAGPQPALLRLAAHGAHLALYALLAALPLVGIAVSQSHSVPVRLFGLFTLPTLVEADPDLADRLSDYHLWSAWALLALVIAHVGAALWHHWWRHDGVLRAMLPARGAR